MAELAAELFAQHAGDEIDRPARREADDQAGGPGLRESGLRGECDEQRAHRRQAGLQRSGRFHDDLSAAHDALFQWRGADWIKIILRDIGRRCLPQPGKPGHRERRSVKRVRQTGGRWFTIRCDTCACRDA